MKTLKTAFILLIFVFASCKKDTKNSTKIVDDGDPQFATSINGTKLLICLPPANNFKVPS